MTTPQPALKPAFEIGVLFGIINDMPILLQVCTDFDVATRELNAELGRGQLAHNTPGYMPRCRSWAITSQKQYDYVFGKFFRPFAAEVRNKPEIRSLILMPSMLDSPIVPNDLGDKP